MLCYSLIKLTQSKVTLAWIRFDVLIKSVNAKENQKRYLLRENVPDVT